MKTQIVYALVASPEDTFLEELWASVFSLRIYEPDREVRVLCDEHTAEYARKFPSFIDLLTELVVISLPEHYTKKERSRAIKTSIRQNVVGKFLFVDTDTIFAGTLEYIDNLKCELAAVPEYHSSFSDYPFRDFVLERSIRFFNTDVSDAERWHNSGVLFVNDSPLAYEFYNQWNDNWKYAAFKKGNSQDQPALLKTDKDMGYVIQELPGEYNCQMAMGMKYFADAKIIHYLHFDLLPKPKHPFLDKSIYKQIKEEGGISEKIAYTIRHCKAAFITPSCMIDGEAVEFLLSNPGHVFMAIAKHGGWMLSLTNKIAAVFAKILKYKGIKIW